MKMIPTQRVPAHPGEILKEEFLLPLGGSQAELARHLGIPVQRINEIVKGKRGISPDTAWLLSHVFGTTPQFWLNLQTNYDIVLTRPKQSDARIPRATYLLRFG